MFVVNGVDWSRTRVMARWDDYDRCEALANCAGRRVAVCFDDVAELICLLLYLRDRGASVLPVASNSPLEAARRMARRAECQVLFFNDSTVGEVLEGGGTDAAAMLLQFSSGTTGEPKVIGRTWQSIDEEVHATLRHFTAPEGRVAVVACPVTHSYGLISGLLTALARGSGIEVLANVNPKAVLKTLMKNEKHVLYASPVYLEILSQFAAGLVKFDAAMTSGVSMSGRSFSNAQRLFTHLYQQYGCSEAGCISVNHDLTDPHCIGTPLPHLTVTAGTDAEHPAEIVVTRQRGEVIRTGDLGYYENGELHFVSRIDDMINTSGLNVYPREVEEVLFSHDAVADAVVYGVADALVGQKVFAQVVPADLRLTPEALRAWCGEQLMAHQIPHQIELVNAIEKAANGKISRGKLATQSA